MNEQELIEQGRREMAEQVADLWVQENGWIPGACRERLSEILGIDLPAPALGGERRCRRCDTLFPTNADWWEHVKSTHTVNGLLRGTEIY